MPTRDPEAASPGRRRGDRDERGRRLSYHAVRQGLCPYGAKKRPRVANRRDKARAGLWSAQMMRATSRILRAPRLLNARAVKTTTNRPACGAARDAPKTRARSGVNSRSARRSVITIYSESPQIRRFKPTFASGTRGDVGERGRRGARVWGHARASGDGRRRGFTDSGMTPPGLQGSRPRTSMDALCPPEVQSNLRTAPGGPRLGRQPVGPQGRISARKGRQSSRTLRPRPLCCTIRRRVIRGWRK